jgi:hypothetical protein
LVSETLLVVVYGDVLLVLLLGANFHAQEGGKAERWKGSLGISEMFFETVSVAAR